MLDVMTIFCIFVLFMQGISDAFQGVAAPLTLVLMVDVLTTTIYLGIGTFDGEVIAALIFLAIAITIMMLWTFCAVCYDLCKAKMYKTKCKRVLINIVIGVGGSLYLIGDNLPPMLELLQSEQQVSNTTCGQLPNNPTSGAALDFLLYKFSLTTYGKVLIGMSVFLFSMFPTCVFKFNTREEIHETILEMHQKSPACMNSTKILSSQQACCKVCTQYFADSKMRQTSVKVHHELSSHARALA